jgi:hypothetical protein
MLTNTERKLQIVRLIDEAYVKLIAGLTSIGTTTNAAEASDFIADLKIKREGSTGMALMNKDPLSQDDLNWIGYVLDSLLRQYYDTKYSLSQDASFQQYFEKFQEETTVLKLQLTR